MSCLFLLKTTVNSICSGISHSAESSVDSELQAAISVGAWTCALPLSTHGLFSTSDFELPLDTEEFGSRFSAVSPFSDAKTKRELAKF